MSMHELGDEPELVEALKANGLPHDKPSQLADAFRLCWAYTRTDIDPQVKVKPLVWAEDDGLYTAKSAFITFFIGEGVAGWEVIWTDYPIHDGLSDVFDTPELAKDAAQALHEASILSAIEVKK